MMMIIMIMIIITTIIITIITTTTITVYAFRKNVSLLWMLEMLFREGRLCYFVGVVILFYEKQGR